MRSNVVKRPLISCDQVFDVLTRGPFPTGDPVDEAVERHLRACHECRQLAEALRPAVALMHEAVAADQAIDLPEYQGALPWTRPQRRRLSVVRLAEPPAPQRPAQSVAPPKPPARVERRQPQWLSAGRLIAASLLIAGLGFWFGGAFSSPSLVSPQPAIQSAAEGVPSAQGLLKLASLKLPAACGIPLTHQPLSLDHAAEIATGLANGSLDALHCCTECHYAGAKQGSAVHLAAVTQRNCQVCHRG
jgi:hypothetical protein